MRKLELGLNLSTTKTHKRKFIAEIERVLDWGVPMHIVSLFELSNLWFVLWQLLEAQV